MFHWPIKIDKHGKEFSKNWKNFKVYQKLQKLEKIKRSKQFPFPAYYPENFNETLDEVTWHLRAKNAFLNL